MTQELCVFQEPLVFPGESHLAFRALGSHTASCSHTLPHPFTGMGGWRGCREAPSGHRKLPAHRHRPQVCSHPSLSFHYVPGMTCQPKIPHRS